MGLSCTVVVAVVVMVVFHSPTGSDIWVALDKPVMRMLMTTLLLLSLLLLLASGTVDSGGSRRQTGDLPPRPDVTRLTTYLISKESASEVKGQVKYFFVVFVTLRYSVSG